MSKPNVPLVVADASFVNQTALIPTTTLFIPNETGLFRVSVYFEKTADAPSSTSITGTLGWTDDFVTYPTGNGTQIYGAIDGSLQAAAGVRMFRARAGTPINFAASASTFTTGSYSAFAVVESLD